MTSPAAAFTYYRVTKPGGAICDVPLSDERVQQLREQGWTVTHWSAR